MRALLKFYCVILMFACCTASTKTFKNYVIDSSSFDSYDKLVSFGFWQDDTTNSFVQDSVQKVNVVIEIKKDEYTVCEKVPVKIKIINTSDKIVSLPVPLVIEDLFGGLRGDGKVWDVGKKGKSAVESSKAPTNRSKVSLKPRAEIIFSIDDIKMLCRKHLDSCFREGVYIFQVSYVNNEFNTYKKGIANKFKIYYPISNTVSFKLVNQKQSPKETQ